MSEQPVIAILSGGISPEREVSLVSGREVVASLRKQYPVEHFQLDKNALPSVLDPSKHIVFPAMHGTFGEDGGIQELLEMGGFSYVGSDAYASALCMDKARTKASVIPEGVRVPRGICGNKSSLRPSQVVDSVGELIIAKPSNLGSSVGLHFAEGVSDLEGLWDAFAQGTWLFEERIVGREFSVGVLGGGALGVVEIIPINGSYDYTHKYTPGSTEYRFPAEISTSLERELKDFTEKAFTICGCRDFARADFMVSENGVAYFLEINTIPGLTPTSLLPKSARCEGHDFDALMRLMIEPAMKRFYAASYVN